MAVAARSHRNSPWSRADLPIPASYILRRGFSTPRRANFLRHSESQSYICRYGNINPLCIGYSLRPHLSSRLTLGRRTLPRKPYLFGDVDFNHIYRYLSLDTHFQTLQEISRFPFNADWNAFLPLSLKISRAHNFGIMLSPVHFRRKFSR